MAKSPVVEDALASVRKVEWQALPPSVQRAFFTGLTSIVLAMLEADITPEGERRTNVDRARRTAVNEDKLALIQMACASLQTETMSEDQLRGFYNLLRACGYTVELILQSLSTTKEAD